ncbi:MAG: 3-oxoacyl-ACP synthase III [Desulfobacterales bacterium]
MRYSQVYIDTPGYELAPHVVTTADLEARLEPLYRALHLQKGQIEALTGIHERRFWDPGFTMHEGAIRAGRKAIDAAGIAPDDIDMLIYGGVCRDQLEPATACAVANGLGLKAHAQVYDVSNACLGVLNGIVHVANAIELGHVRSGLVVSCESAREIIDITIDRLLKNMDMDLFGKTVATLTGGSGAIGVLITDGSVSGNPHRLVGGVIRNATAHHALCRWGPDTGIPSSGGHTMETDSVGVLQNGVPLGLETFGAFMAEMDWPDDKPDKVICHQVGSAHQRSILDAIGVAKEKDFTTFRHLGNVGTVSLPITAAIAAEREFLVENDRVGFFGIGSGLNCLMLGIQW